MTHHRLQLNHAIGRAERRNGSLADRLEELLAGRVLVELLGRSESQIDDFINRRAKRAPVDSRRSSTPHLFE